MSEEVKEAVTTTTSAVLVFTALFLALPWVLKAAKWYAEWAWRGLGTWNF